MSPHCRIAGYQTAYANTGTAPSATQIQALHDAVNSQLAAINSQIAAHTVPPTPVV